MKKLAFLLLLFAATAHAQTTSVSATVTDPNSNVYANGTYKVTFAPNPSFPTAVYNIGGTPINQGPYSGSLSSGGAFTQVLPDSGLINPKGSTWIFQICNFAGNVCFTLNTPLVTGSSVSLSLPLSAVSAVQTGNAVLNTSFNLNSNAITIWAAAGQAADILDVYSYSGTKYFSIGPTGAVFCISGCSGGGGSGVSSFSSGNLPPLFTTSVATPTSTPVLSFTLSTAAANTVFGNFTGSSAAPGFSASPVFSAANLTNFPTFNQSTTGNAATATTLANTPSLCTTGNAPTGVLANGNATGCALILTNPMTTVGDMITASSGGAPARVPAGLTGQVPTANNGAVTAFVSPGLLDGNGGSPVTSASYAIQCDSSTALVDRSHVIRFQSGASTPIVPLSTAAGCTGGFAVTVIDDGAGSLVFSRTSPDTFSVFNGSTNVDGATTFTLTNGAYATLNQGASGIWEVRIVPASSAGGGLSGQTVGCLPVAATATTSTASSSVCDNGVTVSTTEPVSVGSSVTTTANGTNPSSVQLVGNTTLPSLTANTVTILGPPSATPTAWSLQVPTAIPATTDFLSCTTTSTNCLITDTGIPATAAGINAVIQTLTGCNTATNVYTPQGADCVAPSGGGGLSGMVAGQIPIAATATTVTSSTPNGVILAAIHQVNQTAAISTATLCASATCSATGVYRVDVAFEGSGTACSAVTAGNTNFQLTWTDSVGTTHSAVAFAMYDQKTGAMAEAFKANTTLATEGAGGSFVFSSNGSIVQYATTYVACTTGTFQYNVDATVTRLQ